MPSPPPAVLVIAGSDSSAGAGVARDLQVLRDHKCAARIAISAVTAQSEEGVLQIHPLPVGTISAQINAARSDGCVRAIKVGMLGEREIVETLASSLGDFPGIPIVLDPVLASSSKTPLLTNDGVSALRSHLCPIASLITPNLAEAAALLGAPQARDEYEAEQQAQALRQGLGCAVLVKGGHGRGAEATDFLAWDEGVARLSTSRLKTNMRGTGCALSTAIAVALSRGQPLDNACRAAKSYVKNLLRECVSVAS